MPERERSDFSRLTSLPLFVIVLSGVPRVRKYVVAFAFTAESARGAGARHENACTPIFTRGRAVRLNVFGRADNRTTISPGTSPWNGHGNRTSLTGWGGKNRIAYGVIPRRLIPIDIKRRRVSKPRTRTHANTQRRRRGR